MADTFLDPLEIEYIDGRSWRVTKAFDYLIEMGERCLIRPITVPAGFETDFASIPRVFWTILPPTGKYGKAAVIHDYLYVIGGDLPPDKFTKADADRIFYDAMGVLGVSSFVRWVMWRAVSKFGKGAFKT